MAACAPLKWIAASAWLAAAPAFAQSAAQKPSPDTVPEKIAPGAKPSEPTRNLSERLNRSGGVIKPKDVDPAIEKPTPATHDSNTIRPQASPSASPPAQPK